MKKFILNNKILSIAILLLLIGGITWLITSQMEKKATPSGEFSDTGLSQQQIEDNEKFKKKFADLSKKAGKTVAGDGRG